MRETMTENTPLQAKDVVQLRFVNSKSDVSARGASGLHPADLTYVPTYLHQIIPNEQIHGYKSARVAVYVHLGSLTYWVDSSLDAIDDDLPDENLDDDDDDAAAEVTDVEALITPFIKGGLTTSRPAFISAIHNAPETLPVSHLVKRYRIGDDTYGVYKHRLFTPDTATTNTNSTSGDEREGSAGKYGFGPLVKQERFHEFHRRMAFLMFIQIDGASFIDDEDPRWEVFVVAKLTNDDLKLPISFVGYATTYPFAVMHRPRSSTKSIRAINSSTDPSLPSPPPPSSDPASLVTFVDRIRISQVAILPLHQRQGHGAHLVNAIYEDAHSRGAIEITVEDPSRGFRMLRDAIDLQFAYRENLIPPMEPICLDEEDEMKRVMHERILVTPGQARRCLEVHQLRFIDREKDEAAHKKYRLWVKRRLYHEYEDVLEKADAEERKEKLAQLYEDTENEYIASAQRATRFVEDFNRKKRKTPDI